MRLTRSQLALGIIAVALATAMAFLDSARSHDEIFQTGRALLLTILVWLAIDLRIHALTRRSGDDLRYEDDLRRRIRAMERTIEEFSAITREGTRALRDVAEIMEHNTQYTPPDRLRTIR